MVPDRSIAETLRTMNRPLLALTSATPFDAWRLVCDPCRNVWCDSGLADLLIDSAF